MIPIPRNAKVLSDYIEKIFKMISQCKFGIHDISLTELDPSNHLPRFNNDSVSDVRIPSGSKIAERYHLFETDLPLYSETFKQLQSELTFIDFRNLVIEWLNHNPW